MNHKSIARFVAPLCAVLVFAAVVAACADNPPTEPDFSTVAARRPAFSANGNGGAGLGAVKRQLARLRRVTARYHRRVRATRDGYTTLVRHPASGAGCLTRPGVGGMGFHLLDVTLFDGTVTVSNPEVLIYRPMPTGKLHLVAVEYLIPFSIRPANSQPPTLFGREFTANHTFGVWALHAWVWQNNPDGVFANFNPKVSCEDADKVTAFSDGGA